MRERRIEEDRVTLAAGRPVQGSNWTAESRVYALNRTFRVFGYNAPSQRTWRPKRLWRPKKTLCGYRAIRLDHRRSFDKLISVFAFSQYDQAGFQI